MAPVSDAVRAVLSDLGYDGKIQATTEELNGQTIHGFQIQTETLQPAQLTELKNALDNRLGGINEDTYGVELVGPTFGKQIIRNAIIAVILSFLVIVLYLTIRFEYKLALPALASSVATAGRKFYSDDPLTREPETQDASGAEPVDIDLFYDLAHNLFVTPRRVPAGVGSVEVDTHGLDTTLEGPVVRRLVGTPSGLFGLLLRLFLGLRRLSGLELGDDERVVPIVGDPYHLADRRKQTLE